MADKHGLGPAMLKNFYRCFILPRHIAVADGERKASLEAELTRRQADIKAKGKDKELATYVKAQETRQAVWDAYVAVKGSPEGAERLAAVMESRSAFRAEYHK